MYKYNKDRFQNCSNKLHRMKKWYYLQLFQQCSFAKSSSNMDFFYKAIIKECLEKCVAEA